MASEKVIIKMVVRTNKIGSECEDEYETDYTREQWNALTEFERQEFLDDAYRDHLSNSIEGSAWIKEDGEE